MGVVGPAAGALALLVGGAALVAAIEPRLVRRREPGPAAPARPRAEIAPARPDPWLYPAAPLVALLGVAWGAVVIPLGPNLIPADVSIGLFYFIVVVDYTVLGLALGGWAANTRASVEACYRAIAQLVAYVIPLGLAIIGPIMMARSMATGDIVRAQQGTIWYVLVQPLGFGLYVVCALMQSFRAPFLEPLAARVDAGVLGAYGGWKAIVWRIALSGVLVLVAAMGAVLFLGGWAGPILPGYVWMPVKTLALAAGLTWAGARVRPRSTAEMLGLSWKVLVPVGLANVLVVGALILLGVGQPPG